RAHALIIGSAAYVAYMDGRGADAALLFGARLGWKPFNFPNRYRPILEALQNQGHHDQIAAGANLSAAEALERAVESLSSHTAGPACVPPSPRAAPRPPPTPL